MVTGDAPGDHRLIKATGDIVSVFSKVLKDGAPSLGMRLGAVLRGAAAKPFLTSLIDEAKQLVSESRIEAPESVTALAEVVEDLETEVPDARRLDILRRAYLSTAIGDAVGDPEGTQALLFMRTARKLAGEHGVVLGCLFRHRNDWEQRSDPHDNQSMFGTWLDVAVTETGIPFREEIAGIVQEMIPMRLIRGAVGQSPEWRRTANGILEPFAVGFCEFLARADGNGKEGEA